MGALGELFEAWRDAQPYPPSDRRVALNLGVSPTTLGNWLKGSTPTPANLADLAGEMHYPYQRLLDAVMVDMGYLPEPRPRKGVSRHEPVETVSPSGDTRERRRPYAAAVSEAREKAPPRSRAQRAAPKKRTP